MILVNYRCDKGLVYISPDKKQINSNSMSYTHTKCLGIARVPSDYKKTPYLITSNIQTNFKVLHGLEIEWRNNFYYATSESMEKWLKKYKHKPKWAKGLRGPITFICDFVGRKFIKRYNKIYPF